ncbi:MAG: helix-turn-helix transcriptional regulator [Bryobacteraceae bacterium]
MEDVRSRDPILTQVGQRIRNLREGKGISQEVLAEKSGLHRTYIGGVERGLRNPSLKSLQRIAKGLGVGVAHLFQTTDD